MSELYLFEGSVNSYGFTPTVLSKTFASRTYAPTLIKRNALNIEHNFAKNNLTFTFARSHFYAKELLTEIPEVPVLVTIYRTSGATFTSYWQGRVVGAESKGMVININCDSIYSTLRRGGLSPKAGLLCRHVLYSENCGVSQGLWQVSYTATASSTTVAVSGMAEPVGYFNGGIALMSGQSRRIITQDAANIYLSAPFNGVLTGTITLSPGCMLTEKACTAFNNLDNFGGFRKWPGKNPFNSSGLL